MVRNILSWKTVLLFSILFISNIFFSQKIIRFSDSKEFDSITIIEDKEKKIIHKNDIINYKYSEDSKVFHENKSYEFNVDKDELIFFDKIEELEQINIDLNNKKQKINIKKRKKGTKN